MLHMRVIERRDEINTTTSDNPTWRRQTSTNVPHSESKSLSIVLIYESMNTFTNILKSLQRMIYNPVYNFFVRSPQKMRAI